MNPRWVLLRRDRAHASGFLNPALAVPLMLTLLAFLLRVERLSYQSLWRDEVDALRFATQPLPSLMAMFSGTGQNGPFFFLVLRGWLSLAGQSEFALRFLSACFGTLAVPVAYRLVDRLAGRAPAALAALLMAVAPYLVWYAQEAKMYGLLTFLVPLQLWLLVLAVQTHRRRYWILLYVATSLAVYTHLLAALVIPVQLLWILLVPEGRDRFISAGADRDVPDALDQTASNSGDTGSEVPEAGTEISDPGMHIAGPRQLTVVRRFTYALSYLAALVLPYLPVAIWALPMWLSWNYRTGFAFVPLPAMVQALLLAFTRGPVWLPRVPMVPTLLAVVCGGMLWAASGGKGGWRASVLLLSWLLLPVAGMYVLSLGTPVFTERYLIWVLPAFLALAALGISALSRARREAGLLVVGLILAFNIADTAMYQHTPLKSDFRSAATYLLAHRQAGDRLLFQIPYNRYVFSYYAGPLADEQEGPYTNNGASEPQVADLMAAKTAGARAVWLVASEVPMWDRRGLTQAWLDAHGTVTDHADFALVKVVRYELVGQASSHRPSN